ncbi:MAG: cell division ATP-binding protein FtsE [Armatimonadetes bacterium]|nr:cell division ATP-binding protein FtsE [Armatimonadota bacterium]NIO76156.1 cell division ATP-binding protein FtsE [Armatimonadota bacterium]NIO98852.1 cell division ATP-binding protein FtsE [Armatimonadota bacterium]
MIELRDVSAVYPNGTLALGEVNCKIEKGEFVFLVGPTGHGKSSLLKLIHRELIPSKGEVRVAGQDTKTLSPRQVAFLRRRVGMIFQDFRLLATRTLWENVAFALRVTGVSRRRIHRVVPDLLRRVHLSDKADAFPDQVSAGEQQRAAIARALVNSPAILLADEPTGNLDTDTGWGIMKLLADINLSGTTVICATHNRGIVQALRRRVITLSHGKIALDVPVGAIRPTASIRI